jgi:hypothetical protein
MCGAQDLSSFLVEVNDNVVFLSFITWWRYMEVTLSFVCFKTHIGDEIFLFERRLNLPRAI